MYVFLLFVNVVVVRFSQGIPHTSHAAAHIHINAIVRWQDVGGDERTSGVKINI